MIYKSSAAFQSQIFKETKKGESISTISDDKCIDLEGQHYCLGAITHRIEELKKHIGTTTYDSLSTKHKLIIDLPILMWKLGFRHGAINILYWLEPSQKTLVSKTIENAQGQPEVKYFKKSLKYPVEFFTSEDRVRDYDKYVVENMQKWAAWASESDDPDSEMRISEEVPWYAYYLYHTDMNSVNDNYQRMRSQLESNTANQHYGDFDVQMEKWEEVIEKDNTIRAKTIGSSTDRLDTIKAALGRYSFRMYYQGFATHYPSQNEVIMIVQKLAYRFFDSFDFDGWQPLGHWKYDKENPKVANVSIDTLDPFSDWYHLGNTDFCALRDIVNNGKSEKDKIGRDFWIYSDMQTKNLDDHIEIQFSNIDN